MTMLIDGSTASARDLPSVRFYHRQNDDPAKQLSDGHWYVEQNLRCPSCHRPLLIVAQLGDRFNEDDAVGVMLQGMRRLADEGCYALL
ncbi:MAG: hypothetical protein ACR2PL_18870 [Dehalococcoidia bacterium]